MPASVPLDRGGVARWVAQRRLRRQWVGFGRMELGESVGCRRTKGDGRGRIISPARPVCIDSIAPTSSMPARHRFLNPIVPRPPGSSRLLAAGGTLPCGTMEWNHGKQLASDLGTGVAGSLSPHRGECSAGVVANGVRDTSPRPEVRRVPRFRNESASGGQQPAGPGWPTGDRFEQTESSRHGRGWGD